MAGEKVYLSRESYEKLRKDLGYLKKVKRKEISGDIGRAREMGDISENADYDAAKEAQARNEKKISELESTLGGARIIEEHDFAKDEVLIGATVQLKDMNTDKELQYTLVSVVEFDISKNKISVESPVGKGLLGKKENDIVEIKIPRGVLKYKILKISR